MDKFVDAWRQVELSVSSQGDSSAIALAFYMLIGGCLSLYIRWLYRRFSSSPSDTDSITRVFPLLVIITAAVIAIVKSSLALSLGLVGALSIVRFRAAIKEPEELCYLFLCIAVGLSLGAELPLIAVSLVAVSTIFVLIMHADGRLRRENNLLLTVSGDAKQYFSGDKPAAAAAIEEVAGSFTLQRLDVESDRGQLRVSLGRRAESDTMSLVAALRQRLPDCEISYVNLDASV
ncbi:DUF4956 domain-containing protein [Planctomycetes bacterium K23_9]|uniref:DUF4956 domain-containing protein n=1 Tax=Stieleria marina TaxID=1930275 RepID=A0A517NQL4_9BACT|nr:hypothetical protein K239x_13510 [Planctomycetes bacterium K23_9]